MVAHIPKATVQAVFGALPLEVFLARRPELAAEGHTLMVMAVLAIIATAPLGAILLEGWGARQLAAADDPPGAAPDPLIPG